MSATKVAINPAPTQKLRNLIDGTIWGFTSTDQLHNALLDLEKELKLPLTEPIDEE